MLKSKLMVLSVAGVLVGLSSSRTSFAFRRGMPTDGAPFPSTNYSSFGYVNGQVLNFSSAGANWDLTAIMDNTTTVSRTMAVYTNGNGAEGTTCWGTSVAANGSAVLGSGVTGTLTPYPAAATVRTVPAVSLTATSMYFVTCYLPHQIGPNAARIATYYYTPT